MIKACFLHILYMVLMKLDSAVPKKNGNLLLCVIVIPFINYPI